MQRKCFFVGKEEKLLLVTILHIESLLQKQHVLSTVQNLRNKIRRNQFWNVSFYELYSRG